MAELSSNSVFILAILMLNIAICEWLVARTFFRHFGTALLVILVTALESNLGLIAGSSEPPGIYDAIFLYVAPISIFLLLLECNIGAIRKAGLPVILMFLIGSLGTVIGAIAAGMIMNGPDNLGQFFPQIAGMFTGTYTGGSINFNAVALEYNINEEGNLYAGSVAIDNIWTAFWMILTIALPKILSSLIPRKKVISNGTTGNDPSTDNDSEVINPYRTSILVMLGIFAFLISETTSGALREINVNIPSILILTTISLLLAQFKWIQQLSGSRLLGIIGIYLFLAVIGAYCDFNTLPALGDFAVHLMVFVGLIVIIHGLFTFGVGSILKMDWDIIAIASQANVGGSGSALALAKSLKREDLLLPAILIATVGNALGTYLGFLVVYYFA